MCSSAIFDNNPPSLSRQLRETSDCCVVSKTGDFFLFLPPLALLIFLEFPIDLRSLIIIHIHTVLLVTFMIDFSKSCDISFFKPFRARIKLRQFQQQEVSSVRNLKNAYFILVLTLVMSVIQNLEFHQSFEQCFASQG